jgi:hypothetical protein
VSSDSVDGAGREQECVESMLEAATKHGTWLLAALRAYKETGGF